MYKLLYPNQYSLMHCPLHFISLIMNLILIYLVTGQFLFLLGLYKHPLQYISSYIRKVPACSAGYENDSTVLSHWDITLQAHWYNVRWQFSGNWSTSHWSPLHHFYFQYLEKGDTTINFEVLVWMDPELNSLSPGHGANALLHVQCM